MSNRFLSQSLNINGTSIQGPLDSSVDSIGKLITATLKFIFPLAGVILLFVLIWGGYDFMMSQGNPEKVKGAQTKITSGLIGFFLLVASYFLVRLISVIFGLGNGVNGII